MVWTALESLAELCRGWQHPGELGGERGGALEVRGGPESCREVGRALSRKFRRAPETHSSRNWIGRTLQAPRRARRLPRSSGTSAWTSPTFAYS
eukprot:4935677-Alexandrium_andersonii.AAC.1